MNNERLPRGIKMAREENRWFYQRFGVNEEPTSSNGIRKPIKPTVVFDEAKMHLDWAYKRFGVDEE